MRVLVVDDKEENRYLLESLLKAGGHEVDSASDGVDALDKLKGQVPDLIVSDILMPRMDGFQLCRECKQDVRLKSIPLVFYTSAYTDKKDEEFALNLGADRFLTKPMDPMDFLKAIDDVGTTTDTDREPPATPSFEGEDDYLKEYSERLVGQLEKKMDELEEKNKDLEHRVRELNCLHNLTSIGARADMSLHEVLEQAVYQLPRGWRYPDKAAGRIVFRGREYRTQNFSETAWKLSAPVAVSGEEEGRVEVRYLEDLPEADEGPFFEEERLMIETIASRVGEIAARKMAEEDLRWELTVNTGLARLSNTLISSPASISDISSVVLHSARLLTGSEHGFVSSIDPKTGDNVGHTLTGMMKDVCGISEGDRKLVFSPDANGNYSGLWGWSLNKRKPFYTNSPERHEAYQGLPEGHMPLKNFLSVPALISMNMVGQIALANKAGDYTDKELAAVQRLAEFYALALQRKRAEAALGDSEERLRATIEGIGDGIVILNSDLAIFWANSIATARHGDMVGKKCHDAFGKSREYCTSCIVAKTFEDGEIRSAEEELELPDDQRIFYHITASPMVGQDKKISAVVLTFKDITERKREAEELKVSRERLRKVSAHMEKVREEERRGIAREIHDELGQALTALKMDVAWIGSKIELEELREKTREMTRLVDDTVQAVQRISRELRPGILDDLGLAAAVEWQAEEFSRRADVVCDLTIEPEEIELDSQRSITIFRVFQEALTNIARHAGADEVYVTLRSAGGRIRLEVRDNGRGADEDDLNAATSFGVTGMRERVASFCGGELTITSKQGEGTVVVADIPVERRKKKR